MKPATRHTNADEEIRQGYLLQFRVAGVRFAVEANTVDVIADGDWTPPVPSRPDLKNRVVLLGAIFEMTVKQGRRTLVVETADGVCGFVVDSISSEEIGLREIRPVPRLLRGWIRPAVVSGFTSRDGAILSILDLRLLALEVVASTGPN